MKKQTKILTIAVSALAVGLIIIVLGFFLNGGRGFYVDTKGVHTYDSRNRLEEKIELSPFQSISLSTSSAQVNLIESDHFRVEYSLPDSNSIERLEVSDNTLYVQVKNRAMLTFFNFDIFGSQTKDFIDIYYPAGTSFETLDLRTTSGGVTGGNLQSADTKIKISSGNCEINGLTGTSMEVKMTSGNTTLSGLALDRLQSSTSSGNLSLTNVKASDNAKFNLTSGKITINELETGDLTIDVSSGKIQAEDCTAKTLKGHITSGNLNGTDMKLGGMDFSSSSGGITLEGEFSGENKLQATSGNISIQNSLKETECSYTLHATSGKTLVNGSSSTGIQRDGAIGAFDLSTSSGNVELTFGE